MPLAWKQVQTKCPVPGGGRRLRLPPPHARTPGFQCRAAETLFGPGPLPSKSWRGRSQPQLAFQ